ncbi:MAG: hypothetical protein ACI841_002804 [Planctomycetota bacterium]|jgi:hypothetical protein
MKSLPLLFAVSVVLWLSSSPLVAGGAEPIQVFLFLGQSNMEGGDAHAHQIDDYPPFVGAGAEQKDVRYSYYVNAGEDRDWTSLAAVGGGFGPELTFAREWKQHIDAPLAIIKCAIGGTTIAHDWNPASPPEGQQLFRRSIDHVRACLESLRKKGKTFELRALFWHQGENDMLSAELNPHYEERLTQLITAYRRELEAPELDWFVAEISDKGIWGMDHRRYMRTVREQQRKVVAADDHVYWIPTSHLAFEVMGSGQPHYHFGTQGQLQQGVAYAKAYLELHDLPSTKRKPRPVRLKKSSEPLRVYLLAGGRCVEGEDAFVAELKGSEGKLAAGLDSVLYRAFLGGGSYRSNEWEVLRAVEHLGNFGPELTLAKSLENGKGGQVALLKITDSASLTSDWDPTGEDANRPIFEHAVAFVREALADLDERGIEYQLEGVFWHHGGNESYYSPFRAKHAERLQRLIAGVRDSLDAPELPWTIAMQSDKAPWGEEQVAALNLSLRGLAEADPFTHVFDPSSLPHARIHFGTQGTLELGERFAAEFDAKFVKKKRRR